MNGLKPNRWGWTPCASGLCLLLLTAAGCGSSGSTAPDAASETGNEIAPPPPDGGGEDQSSTGGAGGGADADVDSQPDDADGGTVDPDAGVDADGATPEVNSDGLDTPGTDAIDVPPEAAPEASDTSPDGEPEGGVEVPTDTPPEAPSDGGPTSPDGGDGPEAGPGNDNGEWLQPPAGPVAALPPMGWNSWNTLGCNVGEQAVRAAADALVSTGMRELGYQYVNIDDCWQTGRGTDGAIIADPDAFPSGMKALADYVHSKGLKFGLYSDRGPTTCQGRPGSQSFEAKDARTYAAWGVDYLKYDDCNSTMNQQTQYKAMSTAIAAAGRPVVLSLKGGFAEYMISLANTWHFANYLDDSWTGVMDTLDTDALFGAYARPSGFNDADVLQVGLGGMTTAEYRAHFSLWSILGSPLIASNDLTKMSSATEGILTNPEVIAVDQDPLGYQGYRALQENNLEIWVRPLKGAGNRAVLLLNRTDVSATMLVRWTDVGMGKGTASVRDLWARQDRGSFQNQYTVQVPSHDVVLLKVTGQEPAPPHGAVFVTDLTATYAANGWGPVERDRSNAELTPGDGHTLSIAQHTYQRGLGVHGGSMVRYHLGGQCTRFRSAIGVDDEVATFSTIVFEVVADGVSLFKSNVMRPGGVDSVDVDVTGARELKLVVTNAGDGMNSDHGDWGDARLDCLP